VIDPTNANTAQASALTEELARAGVRRAVVSPGSRSTPLALALDREEAIEVEVVLDERAGGFLALGAALASGEPVAVTCTSGSAAANLHPAVVEADLAGVPLIVLTNDRPPELRDIGSGQTIDQIGLYGGAVRWFCEVGSHAADDTGLLHFRSVACRAAALARGERGPVHLNLAWRDPLGPEPVAGAVSATDPLALQGRDGGRPLTTGLTGREPHPELIEALLAALDRSHRPLLVAGRDPRPGVCEATASLASVADIPVLAEPTSGMRVGSGAGRHSIAHYDLLLRDPVAKLEPDLVLRVGDMPTSKPLRAWLARPEAPDQIVVGAPGRWNEPTRRAGALIDADPVAVLRALAAAGGLARERAEWNSAWREADAAAEETIAGVLARERDLNEPGLAREFAATLREGERALLASSMPVRDVEAFAAVDGFNDARLYANRGANGIDGAIATACGLALGTSRPTWALLGDLATSYDASSLAIAAAARLPLRLVVADNGGGRIFEFLPQAQQVERERFERLFLTPSRVDLEALAHAYGIAYRPLRSTDSLRRLSDETEGPLLIHARTDGERNHELHARIAAEVRAQLHPGA
jgi:2-succinyl-5-enolpyruvyl-6-hydroxy-3-cyclohexene-1-carboxylate synthase